MIDPNIQHDADAFTKRCAAAWPQLPSLVPDGTWMTPGVLDVLCYWLRYRDNWSAIERAAFREAMACLGVLVYRSWESFTGDVQLHEVAGKGITCESRSRKGLLGKEVNTLPIEAAVMQILQKPKNPMPALGKQFVMVSDATDFIRAFSLGACLGMSPYGVGPWSQKMPGELKEHIDKAVPVLARSAAAHYKRLYGEGPPADPALYESALIWPPAGYHGDFCGSVAAHGIAAYEASHRALTNQELSRLARLPDDTISGGALVTLISRITPADVTPSFVELCFRVVTQSGGGYRSVAIDLAREQGRSIDWLETQDPTRFKIERYLSLLPFVNLSFERCTDALLRPVVEKLINMDDKGAREAIDELAIDEPWMAFQRAMLAKVRGDYPQAQAELAQIETKWPNYADAEYLGEYGMNCLNLDKKQQAAELIGRAARIDPPRWSGNHGWALMSLKNLTGALAALDQACSLSHMRATALLNRCWVRRELGDAAGAEEDLLAAARLAPYDRRVVSNLIRRAIGG